MTVTDYGPDAGVTWAGPAKWFSKGRSGPGIHLAVIHTTEGSEGYASAEGGISYDKTRPDSVSCHVFHDADSSPQEVLRADTAFGCFPHGNAIGVQHELCGTAHQTAQQWQDAVSQATLRRAARAVADDCRTYGLEPRRLSVAEVRAAYYGDASGNRPKGICSHVDVTQAFPEDGGDHTDPGTAFPWDQFVSMVQGELDMTDTNQTKRAGLVADAFTRGSLVVGTAGDPYPDKDGVASLEPGLVLIGEYVFAAVKPALDAITARLDAIESALSSGGSGGPVAAHEHSGGTSGPVAVEPTP